MNRKIATKIVGKTGTAQVVALSKQVDHVEAKDVAYEHRDHAWFAGIYPKNNPKIVTIVMTEHAGFGSSYSAPVAIRLMKKWDEKFSHKNNIVGGLNDN